MKEGALSGQRCVIRHGPDNFSSVGVFDLPARDAGKVLKNIKSEIRYIQLSS